MHAADLFLPLAVIWLAAKIGGELADRIGQPAVLGELLAGILIGPGALALVSESPVIHGLAEIGVAILLFEIGLEADLDELVRAGAQSTAVALVGIAAPFALGYLFAAWWGFSTTAAIFVGATLTATSVGITARVLADLGQLRHPAARVVLGAAIIDDVLGLVILATVTAVAQTGRVSAGAVALILVKAVGFLVVALLLGVRFAPALMRLVTRLRVRGALIVVTLAACLLVAALAEWTGLATIIGAFAMGLVLAKTEPRAHIEHALKPISDVLVPVFFVSVGMKADLSALNPFGAAGATGAILAGALTVLAVAGKLASGLAIYQQGVPRWPVGVGMVPRGEVGLIFAGIGLVAKVIDDQGYTALLAMVLVSTLIVPPWLRVLFRRSVQPAPGARTGA